LSIPAGYWNAMPQRQSPYENADWQIFLTDSFSYLDSFSQLKVIHFLEKHLPKIAMEYIEFMLSKRCEFTEVHNKYAKILLSMILADASSNQYKLKLNEFLLNSLFYNAEKLLQHFSSDDLEEERAILLGRVGKHMEALEMLVHRLHSIEKAEEYAVCNYPNCPEIFLFLVQTCMKPLETDSISKVDTACKLLFKYASRISTLKVMEIFPETASLSKIGDYLSRAMMHQSNVFNSLQILKNLSLSLHLLHQEKCLLMQSHRVTVSEHSNCAICKKKIGSSVIAASYEKNAVSHFVCYRNAAKERKE
jgi:hypothetical protein